MTTSFWTATCLCALAACSDSTTADAPVNPGNPDAPTTVVADAPPGSPDARPGSPDAPSTSSGWRAITLPSDQAEARVTGIYCTARDACVATTELFGDPGKVLAVGATASTGTLVSGADVNAAAHVLGDIGFLGLEKTRAGLTARVEASGAYVAATGDFSKASSWKIVAMGTSDGDDFGLNAQESIQQGADGKWLFINYRGYVYGSTAAPAADTSWTKLWSPTATPPVPADFETRFAADPTLCDSDVTTGAQPFPTQAVWVSQDLSLAIFPAGGLNQDGSATPGVCISTDGGKTFYNVPFTGVPDVDTPGPLAVTCNDKDHCFAYSGLDFQQGTAYVYYSTNASMGKASTWTKATVPAALATSDSAKLRSLFFAPDGTHGWIAGSNNNMAMLLRTTDGGKNWTDVSTAVRALTTERLHSGFALDADHIWVGGENGVLLANDSAGQ